MFWLLPLILACWLGTGEGQGGQKGPNIVFVLVDDVGWADFSYNVEGGKGSIPTPGLDVLAEEGVKLKSHYVHPTCTPSRAALMTGRYAANTGLPFAMFPGSVAGLPADMATLPQLLRGAGYQAHMVGKWHLGHAQRLQGPVGRGFQSHTGSFMWDLESYTKLMWSNPVTAIGADWVVENENGSFVHRAEPRHATEAITSAAIARMEEHKAAATNTPLFLYVSYNAAHSPLQPRPEDLSACSHLPHLWRRQYCGMVVGLDRGIARLAEEARSLLGRDTVLVVTPDNGGSVWFGGLNEPLRSGKLTPFEGGVRVPAFALDFSGRRVVGGGEEVHHLVHISDWLPTFMDWAGAGTDHLGLDGVSQASVLKGGEAVRTEVLLELFSAHQSHDGSESAAFRKGRYKVISGHTRDPNWYTEPSQDHVATSDTSFLPRVLELLVRALEWTFGNGPCDMTHGVTFNALLFNIYMGRQEPGVMLFDLEEDPEERKNIAAQNPDIVQELLEEIEKIRIKMPASPRYWMVSPNWTQAFQPGDCSGQTVLRQDLCRFAHPWLPDSSSLTDEASLGLENGFKFLARQYAPWLLGVFLLPLLLSLALCYCCCKARGAREKTQGGERGSQKIQHKQKFVGSPRKKQQPNKKQKQN